MKVYRNDKGQLHRIDGPAVERANGTMLWYKEGARHRIDGPAIEYVSGTVSYWINGKNITKKEFKKEFKKQSKKLNPIIPKEMWLI